MSNLITEPMRPKCTCVICGKCSGEGLTGRYPFLVICCGCGGTGLSEKCQACCDREELEEEGY